jgi:peptidoglycan/xylan/chitin deacetylase (PgdA/CDA1 family)
VRRRRRSALILAYHGVADLPLSVDPMHLMIPERALRAQVQALREAGFRFVTVAELAGLRRSGRPTHGLAALTFDDGLASVLEPLMTLAKEGVRASVYPVVAWIGGRHPMVPQAEQARMLDAVELRALAEIGVEIGAHSITHTDLSTLSYSDCLRELRGSREMLEEITSRPVLTLAYPYGRHTELVRRAAREAGFIAALAVEDGGPEPLALVRAPVQRPHGWTAFTLKAAGVWPALRRSQYGRALRFATRPLRARAQRRRDSGPGAR